MASRPAFTGPPPWLTQQWSGNWSNFGPPQTNSAGSATSGKASTIPQTSSSDSTSPSFPTSSDSSTAAPNQRPSQQNNTAVIVGSTVGGVCALLLLSTLLLAFCFFRRSRHRRHDKGTSGSSSPSTLEEGVTPYTFMPSSSDHSGEKRSNAPTTTRITIPPNPTQNPSSHPPTLINGAMPGESISSGRSITKNFDGHSESRSLGSRSVNLEHEHAAAPRTQTPETQAQIQTEPDVLRNQIAALQQAVVSSNDGVENLRNTIATIVAQMQVQRSGSLVEHRHDSDMDRDDPPPVYSGG